MSGSEHAFVPLLALLAGLFSGDKGPTPALIKVPEALADRSATIEPSGIVWSAALGRYLVVSDDTGDSDNHHQPWLLAMTRDGAFDEEPVPILGIDEVNDGESICAGPNGMFFLTTSHSLNLRGRSIPTRQMLLLLKLEGRALHVEGRVDLTTARAADGRGSLLEIAGLPRNGHLDIEAVTYRDKALLIGLKAPLSERDGAVILRLEDPVAALRAKQIPPGAVTRLWEIALHVTKHRIPQGIADLTSLPDGSMVLVANSPKGRKEDRGGALYWYRPGAGEAQLLRRFKELHPEGVTLEPDGKSLVVVFDNNTGPPMWVRWPVPVPIQGMN